MSALDRFILTLTCICAILASYNAGEAHRHAHELACYVQDPDLCAYHQSESRHE